jgi:hypothetical protein
MGGVGDSDLRGLSAMAAMVLCVVAGILILAILGGSKDVAAKSASFALVLALFSLPAAAGVYLGWVRPGLVWLGALTTVAAVAAFVAVIAAAWHGNIFEGGGDWKTAWVLTLISIGTGQGALILSLARLDDSPAAAALRWVALIPIAALTIIGAEDISSPGEGATAKTYGALGILYVLSIALPPLVALATREDEETPVSHLPPPPQ